MKKNIIICSDGTGNTTIKNRGTNVFKLFEAIKTNNSKKPQIAIYDDGVGSGTTKFSQIVGGAFGYGLSRNVKHLYLSLVRNYEPGDNIYLFGFSRGAFTVRSLAGMICYMGILDRSHCETESELQAYVDHAYREYRHSKRALLETVLSWLFVTPILFYKRRYKEKENTHLLKHEEFKQRFSVKQITNENQPEENKLIRFIGVWDTVSAVGFPVPWMTWLFNTLIYRYSFTDNYLNADVEHACHALSIDDQRKTFHPDIWNEKNEKDKQRIEQVWFAGVHSNVGGGYPKQGLSLVALNWMMCKATDAGIAFIRHDLDLYAEKQNVNDKLHGSRSGFSVYYRYKPRNIHEMCKQNDVTPVIHSSAINRLLQGTAGYAPGNLPKGFVQDEISIDCCNWPNASEEISAALGDDNSLLERVRPHYFIRKFSHGIFFIASIYAIYDFFHSNPEIISSDFDLSALPLDLLKYLLTQGECLFGISCTLVIITVFYLLLRYAKEKMHDVYSAFYYQLIRKHKDEHIHDSVKFKEPLIK